MQDVSASAERKQAEGSMSGSSMTAATQYPATNPIPRHAPEPDHVFERVVADLGIDPERLSAEIAHEIAGRDL